MTLGPVEYLTVSFPGNRFSGEILPELRRLLDAGTVRLLDLVFIMKDENGEVAAVEVDETDDLAPYTDLEGEVGGLIGETDIAHAAQALPPDTSAALLIWEDTWAAPFAEALRRAGGVLLEGGRIPHDLIEPAMDALGTAG